MTADIAPATPLYDLDRASGPVQRAEWARANTRAALRDVRLKIEALRAALTVVVTPSGQPVTCDGCGVTFNKITDDMVHPVLYPENWAGEDLVYIVCPPLPDGTQRCLKLAQLLDEEYDLARCRQPGCTGTPGECGTAG